LRVVEFNDHRLGGKVAYKLNYCICVYIHRKKRVSKTNVCAPPSMLAQTKIQWIRCTTNR
jgi:hypothetical protein